MGVPPGSPKMCGIVIILVFTWFSFYGCRYCGLEGVSKNSFI